MTINCTITVRVRVRPLARLGIYIGTKIVAAGMWLINFSLGNGIQTKEKGSSEWGSQ